MDNPFQAVYDRIPSLECKGLCVKSCGPIEATVKERHFILKKYHRVLAPDHTGRVCRLLENDKCSIYEDRPLICRLFGVADTMKCPHGCAPAQYLNEDESFELFKELAK